MASARSLETAKREKTLLPSILPTSNCRSPALRLFGLGPVAADGYGIGYIIKENGIGISPMDKLSAHHRKSSNATFASSHEGHSSLDQTTLVVIMAWFTFILLDWIPQDGLADPCPFKFRPVKLASLLDPKNLDALEVDGINTLLDGLRTDPLGGLTLAGTAGAGMTASTYLETMFFPSEPAKVYLPSCGSPCKIKFFGRLTCAWLVPRFWDTSASLLASPLNWVEGVAIMIAVLIVVVVGSINDWQKERQFKVLNEKKEEHGVKVICNGVERLINLKEVIVGNVALSEPGEIVPCDGIFLAGHNIKFDETAATGKSDAIKKASYADCLVLEQALSSVHAEGGVLGGVGGGGGLSTHTDCFVVSGSKVLEGISSYVVVAVGTESFNGRIMMGVYLTPPANAPLTLTPLARLMRLSLMMTTSTEVKGTAQSVQFGDELMIRAKHGLLERQSEENMVKVGMMANSLSYFRFCVHCLTLWFQCY
ncbi:E1-E2 ATPase-domain-containing protein [Suillus occidentalis]|nr:E1-E2 ATPase-domain-containing protein [Suillus occidentalis]